jgi:ParB family transcriptional regulator, chromosome partitioning protein
MATYVKNQLYQVPLAEVQPDPAQPRKYMDPQALEEMTASVGQIGIIVPIVCRQDPKTGLIYVVAGERRCAAARKAGLAVVPAIFIESTNYAEIALVENLLRQDLNPVEEAEALQRLMDDHAYTQGELAGIIGKSPTTISEALSLNRLPQPIRDECRQDPAVPKNVLVKIAKKKQARGMLTEFRKYREQQAKEASSRTTHKRTRAEALVSTLGALDRRIADLDFPSFSTEDRQRVVETLTALKDTLDEALDRAAQGGKVLA